MTDVTIREATREDAEAIREVHRASVLELGLEGYDQRQVEAWAAGCDSADYTEPIDAEDVYAIVATATDATGTVEHDAGKRIEPGDFVGFGTLRLDSTGEYEADVDAEVTGVYVHPAVFRQGVGSQLYATLERAARERGMDSLGLWASRNAVAFYERHGYRRVTEHDHEFSSHASTGVEGTVVEMQKDLS